MNGEIRTLTLDSFHPSSFILYLAVADGKLEVGRVIRIERLARHRLTRIIGWPEEANVITFDLVIKGCGVDAEKAGCARLAALRDLERAFNQRGLKAAHFVEQVNALLDVGRRVVAQRIYFFKQREGDFSEHFEPGG